ARAGGTAVRRALHEAYVAEARAAVGRMLPRYLGGLPRPPRMFRFRALSSLWGSLAPDGTVSMDLSLVLGPPAAFEYVLVHELCHLLRADHSPAFWAEVEARWPDWRAQRGFLRSPDGLALKARWRAIVATR
ncbi:MAG: YgjP-like metallopeptidase domain-containing protein, partial [Lysobacteraceae bacterium]